MSKKNQLGFTFIEIVIAFILIGILAGIAAAKYFDMSESSGASVCSNNRNSVIRTLMYQATVSKALNSTDVTKSAKDDALKAIGATVQTSGSVYTGLCPVSKDNIYTVTTVTPSGETVPAITVTCAAHGFTRVGTDFLSYLGDPETLNAILTIVTEFAGAKIDSGATAVSDVCNTALILAKMEAQLGFTMADVGAATWQYLASGVFSWTNVDISGMDVGTSFPVICYDGESYSVCMTTVKKGTTATGGNVTYNIIGSFTALPSGTTSTNLSFEDAMQLLKDTQQLLKDTQAGM